MKWQARFRRWYDRKLTKENDLDAAPQDLQSGYPSFDELKDDMMDVTRKLINYRNQLRKIVIGD